MPTLVEKVEAIAAALTEAGIPHAFGGALALAYATEEPRGTRDVDVNVFVAAGRRRAHVPRLPGRRRLERRRRRRRRRDEQVRLWWDDTPVDVFFAAHPFHLAAGRRAVDVDFLGRPIRVLAPEDLATFKVLFDRPKDWVDIATMLDSGTLDLDAVIGAVGDLLGDDDERVGRLRAMSR